MASRIRRAPIVGRQYTFEPKRCGVTLDQVAFGAVLGAQGRAWPHRQKKVKRGRKTKRKVRKRTASEKQEYNTVIKYLNQ